jgi:hypothetical protein
LVTGLLARPTGAARPLADALARLAVTPEDRAQARETLLRLLAHPADPATARALADTLAGLDPPAVERAQAREALLGLLARETDPQMARELADALAVLNPSVADLGGSDCWRIPPTVALLAAARHNSRLSDWLAAVPLLSRSARIAADPHGAPTPLDSGWFAFCLSHPNSIRAHRADSARLRKAEVPCDRSLSVMVIC